MSGLTKIFIVLQLVFSLVLSVLLVLMVSKQEPYKNMADSQRVANIALAASNTHLSTQNAALSAANADKDKALQDAMAKFQTDSAASTAKLADDQRVLLSDSADRAKAQTQITSLSNSLDADQKLLSDEVKQVEDIRPKLATLERENAELSRANNDLQNQQRSNELAVRKLQEQIANTQSTQPGAAAPSGDTGAQVASLSATNQNVQINGKVTDVAQSAGRTLIETGLGTRDNVKVDTRFAIYRNDKYVADAVVTRVTVDKSVAAIITSKPGETVQPGDLVTSSQ